MRTPLKAYLIIMVLLHLLDVGSTYYALGYHPERFEEQNPLPRDTMEKYGLIEAIIILSLLFLAIIFIGTLILEKVMSITDRKNPSIRPKPLKIFTYIVLSIGVFIKGFVVVNNFILLFQMWW